MPHMPYKPIFELTRGQTVESIHDGAIAIVDVSGNLVAWFGDPGAVTFLRSSSKPFQALPFIERGGHLIYGFNQEEIAITCASHSGTNEHVAVINSIQQKIGVTESELMCGVHYPLHEPTANEMRSRGVKPTPNQHNCSGKHTGMLAFTRLTKSNAPNHPYIGFDHPIQKIIINTFAEMCGLLPEQINLGVDGCSAPNFAVPLWNAAWAYARLCDPKAGNIEPQARQAACQTITSAMWNHPNMVGGPGRFDTRLMEIGAGRFVSKGGAEGYQGFGIMAGVISPNSPALGVAFKIADGDIRGKVSPAVGVEVLRQLGALTQQDAEALAVFGPTFNIFNWRKIMVGEGRTIFNLEYKA
jgi:L-asparaginase II